MSTIRPPRPGEPDRSRTLRALVFELDPSSVGLAPGPELPRVFALVMDSTYARGAATVVAIADGTTSMYFSNGGGLIGMGRQPHVAQASRRLLLTAEAHADSFGPSTSSELPEVGRVRITILTYAGHLVVEAAEDDLGGGRHPASPVFHAAHGVIAAIRLTEEGQAAAPSPPKLSGGATPLMGAAHLGHVQALVRMVEQGADVEARDDRGYTALMYAANGGRDEAIEALLDRGADPNAADGQRSTALMFAAQHGHLGIVRRLLAAGAYPNARGDHGLTALGFARQNRHPETVAALTSTGADS